MPDTTSRQPTSYCIASAWWCELCGRRGATTVIRDTTHGAACMDLCQRCLLVSEPIRLRTATAAHEHLAHVTRARDRGELQ